jgi:1-acyl-sn-glycerol-3-phosphate acyltransferase
MDQALVKTLRSSLLEDMLKDLADSRRLWLARILRILVWPSVTRFAEISAIFDDYVNKFGFNEAMRRITPYFVSDLRVWGQGNVPTEGPLLVISNHPGSYDSIAISAALPRNDLKIVAGGYPFLRHLPAASQNLIFVSADIQERTRSLRNAIRHLQHGSSLLIFPSGRVEPDPAVLPGASRAMSDWSPSLELILRRVPDAQVLITIASGVLSPRFLGHPLIRFWRQKRDPQTVAEVLQVLIQMLFPNRVSLSPNISFYLPLTLSELTSDLNDESLINHIIRRARDKLESHRQQHGLARE